MPDISNKTNEDSQNKRRNPYICALLNVLFFGLGYLYLGRADRAFTTIALFALTVVALSITNSLPTFYGFAIFLIASFSLLLTWLLDGYFCGRRDDYKKKWYNHWSCYVVWIILSASAGEIYKDAREPMLGYGIYSARSQILAPDILQGEVFLADTRFYHNASPQIGEIVVVISPEENANFARRITAISADNHLTLKGNGNISTPSDAHLANIPTTNLVGRTTYILYSHDFSRIGKVIQ